MDLTKREKTGIYVFAAVILFLISYIYFSGRDRKIKVSSAEVSPVITCEASPSPAESQTDKTISVYICGAVEKPGVYSLMEGDRIGTLINIAGGATLEADLTAINLAARLEDEQYVRVPANGEESEPATGELAGTSFKTGNSSLININTADESELDRLPGIGPATAARIIAYRENNGKFTDIEQIKNVSGIGNSKYDNIKDLIYVK